MILDGQRIVVTGGTGSLGKCLVRRLLRGDAGKPSSVVVFSRDEAKQHAMRQESHGWSATTDEVIYGDRLQTLQFVVGDVRDYRAVSSVLQSADVVIHAAALKQVPTCEYNPLEAVLTNVMGAANITRALREGHLPVDTVLGVSTDKAVKPVNVYGMTKAIQERLFLVANLGASTRYISVRYGNVLASRGSVVPLFRDQIERGGPVTVTAQEMTRFFFTIDDAVDTVFAALKGARPGETWVPRLPAVRMQNLADVLIDGRPIEIEYTGIRPGEKLHEVLVSEEEVGRTVGSCGHYVVRPILPEVRDAGGAHRVAWEESPADLRGEFCSAHALLPPHDIRALLARAGLLEGGLPCES